MKKNVSKEDLERVSILLDAMKNTLEDKENKEVGRSLKSLSREFDLVLSEIYGEDNEG